MPGARVSSPVATNYTGELTKLARKRSNGEKTLRLENNHFRIGPKSPRSTSFWRFVSKVLSKDSYLGTVAQSKLARIEQQNQRQCDEAAKKLKTLFPDADIRDRGVKLQDAMQYVGASANTAKAGKAIMSQDERSLLFNTAALGIKDPVGNRKFPSHIVDIRPAQREVIPYVLEKKVEQLSSNPDQIPVIKVWKDGVGKLHIQDGQHRFVACCMLRRPIKLEFKKNGIEAFRGSWGDTVYGDENVVAAKDRLKTQSPKKQP
ncbi:hypothetical protein ACWJJH_16900 [Endozoicomonadaceae bacterium StTr2]